MVDSELNAFLQEREYLFGELRKAHTQIDQLESKLEGMAHHQDLISERGDHTLAYLLNNLIFKHPLPTIMIRRNGMVVKANEAFEKHCVSSDHPIAISIKSIVQTDELPKLVTWLNSISADDVSASILSGVKLKGSLGVFSFVPSMHLMVKNLIMITILPENMMAFEPIMSLSRNVLDQINEGIWIADELHNVIYINQAYIEMTGYSIADQQARINEFERTFEDMWSSIRDVGFWKGNIKGERKNGEAFTEQLNITKVHDAFQGKVFFVAVSTDISEQQKQKIKLDRLAHFDSLTGLANRNLFSVISEKILLKARRVGATVGFLFIDLDHFKSVNDNFGHDEGDQLLKMAALRIVSTLRDSDIISRQGGDEFVVLLDGITEIGAQDVAEKLNRVLSDPYDIGENTHRISASIGIAMSPRDGVSLKDLLRRSDSAMYLAKESGRGQSCVFRDEIEHQSLHKNKMESILWDAIEQDRLQVFYQPVYDLNSGSSLEFEALVRIVTADGVMLNPQDFIPIAEKCGLISSITSKVIDKTLSEISRLIEQYDCKVRINFSALDFNNNDLLDHLNRAAKQYNICPEAIGIEVTESAIIRSVSQVRSILMEAKTLGYSILMDDFGVGYASFSNIRDLPFTHVKIDQSFVSGSESDGAGQALIKAVVDIASYYGFKVVAEGVETADNLDMVKSLGCDAAQGFALARPMPIGELNQWYKGRASNM